MAVPAITQVAPYKTPGGQTAVQGPPATGDWVTIANGGQVQSTVTIVLTGSASQVAADWATLAATSLTAAAVMTHNAGDSI